MITREDVETIEGAAEALVRLHAMTPALELWALALRLRVALNLPAGDLTRNLARGENRGSVT